MKGNQKWRKLKAKLGVKLKIGLITVIKSCLYFVFFFFVCCFAYTKRELYKLKVKHNKYQYIYKILYISLSVCVWVCVSLMLLCCWTIWFRITLLYIYYIYIYIGYIYQLALRYLYSVIGLGYIWHIWQKQQQQRFCINLINNQFDSSVFVCVCCVCVCCVFVCVCVGFSLSVSFLSLCWGMRGLLTNVRWVIIQIIIQS